MNSNSSFLGETIVVPGNRDPAGNACMYPCTCTVRLSTLIDFSVMHIYEGIN